MTPDEIEKALAAGAGLVPVSDMGMVNVFLVEDPWEMVHYLSDRLNDAATAKSAGGRKRQERANLLAEFIRQTYLASRFTTAAAASRDMDFCRRVMDKSDEIGAGQSYDNVEGRIAKALVGVKK